MKFLIQGGILLQDCSFQDIFIERQFLLQLCSTAWYVDACFLPALFPLEIPGANRKTAVKGKPAADTSIISPSITHSLHQCGVLILPRPCVMSWNELRGDRAACVQKSPGELQRPFRGRFHIKCLSIVLQNVPHSKLNFFSYCGKLPIQPAV